jgi:hypothetical protein
MTVSDLLQQPCNKSDDAIKLVTSCYQLVTTLLILSDLIRLFQQVRYSHDKTILLQPLLHSCYIMTVSDLLEQPCNKSDNAIKLVTSCRQLVSNLLQQLGTSSAKTTCRQLANRFVTTCLQTFVCVLRV